MFKVIIFILFFFNINYANDSLKTYSDEIANALSLIERYYPGDVNREDLTNAAINGMLGSLDPYGKIFSKENFKSYTQPISESKYAGLGIVVKYDDKLKNVVVVSVMNKSPAQKSGIVNGDRIIKIDGVDVSTISFEEISNRIRGKIGEKVFLIVRKKYNDKEQQYSIKRENIEINNVKSYLYEDICYISLNVDFNSKSPKHIRDVMSNYASQGNKINGIILDLRGNPGGELDAAKSIANYFINSGVMFKIKTKVLGNKNKYLENDILIDKNVAKAPNVPLVVLINEGSASASELLSASIKDNKRGVLVGEKSFGKGIGQGFISTGINQKVMKLTTFEFLSPKGNVLHKSGVMPDIVVKNKKLSKKKAKKIFDSNQKENLSEHEKLLSFDKQYVAAFDIMRSLIVIKNLK